MEKKMLKELNKLIIQIDLYLDFGKEITKKQFKDFNEKYSTNFLNLAKNIKQNTFFYNMTYDPDWRETIDDYQMENKFYELNTSIAGMLIINELWTESVVEWTKKSFDAFVMSIYNSLYSVEEFRTHCAKFKTILQDELK